MQITTTDFIRAIGRAIDAFTARAVEAAVAKERARCRAMMEPECTAFCRWEEIVEAVESGRKAP